MNLLRLAQRLGRELGMSLQSPTQRETLYELINDAAEQIYTQTDLPRCLLEEQVSVDTTDPLPRVTLPSHVGELRAVRDYQDSIRLHDIRPKFHRRPWPEDSLYVFRILGERAVCRSIDNTVPLYMVPFGYATDDVTVSIVGKTSTASEVHATFSADGTGTAATVNWEEIYSISKDNITANDVVFRVGDANGAEIAKIHSYADVSRYVEIELQERPSCCSCSQIQGSRCFEILYKPVFRALQATQSRFQLEGYDLAIIYTAVKIYKLRGLSETATEMQIKAAQVHNVRADEILKQIIANKTQGQDLILQKDHNRMSMSNLRGLRKRRYNLV